MCGITGYIGTDPTGRIVHEGLQNLEYRGYDSAGIALAGGGSLSVHKTGGEVGDLPVPSREDGTRGIGHTRWSTHGEPTRENAHPHTDCTGDVAVVHNGIIENYAALADELRADHVFHSDTDTEVVPHLIETHLADGVSLLTAVQRTTERLTGSYALAITAAGHDGIVVARSDSPLLLGHGDTGTFVASDATAFIEHTNRVTYLRNGDIAHLTETEWTVYNDGARVSRDIEALDWSADAAGKSGYDHYMLKEIHEQPRALRQAISGRISDLGTDVTLDMELSTETLQNVAELQIVACGTSYHAGLYAKELLETHADLPVTVHVASEYELRGGRSPEDTLVVAITQSGETADTLAALRSAAQKGAPTLALTNTLGSTVTREADDALFIRAGPEIGVAATKTFVSQVATAALLTMHIGRARNAISTSDAAALRDAIRDLPGAVQQVLDQAPEIASIAREYADSDAFFYVGRRAGRPVALESALKLKEISYDHAEGFSAGELKHGPLALVTDNTPVVAVLTEYAAPERTANNVKEVQSRGADVIGLASDAGTARHADVTITLPACGPLEPVVANVALQLFAYHIANEKGRPIDKPRNLAKSVTVE
ncbi:MULTISPECIES: glutamine--fructose-6-phosphate transaminase (isomerizing) [Halobacterium]|uniref:glutamine--fructose-6-phosphate transaminase (isomerizing) n=1 Tax=Halobacterium TaxID=2239 RepID=UPI00196362FE|nr:MULTISPECIES: glutamine--fructose-6-phosphate transaminase (isomerizing) [Halobacterium]MCF2164660.1 glutamine--fructose-6-phosphate transaminase (isomerizing) [Halobacterium salinarum]MCF2166894.1 glutamine--fructose-6-phosphate transaminase (isomerizing) [Halobacterium salinarum]QRY22766.1 glutamine--fructose-6-phosphate transaminase (isomerizing) [Halobacterium sp. GSL-19]WJK64075.1 glutamine--fructose-6-phosphate transaminase (isomerizing) [Halobacterium salinarum]